MTVAAAGQGSRVYTCILCQGSSWWCGASRHAALNSPGCSGCLGIDGCPLQGQDEQAIPCSQVAGGLPCLQQAAALPQATAVCFPLNSGWHDACSASVGPQAARGMSACMSACLMETMHTCVEVVHRTCLALPADADTESNGLAATGQCSEQMPSLAHSVRVHPFPWQWCASALRCTPPGRGWRQARLWRVWVERVGAHCAVHACKQWLQAGCRRQQRQCWFSAAR